MAGKKSVKAKRGDVKATSKKGKGKYYKRKGTSLTQRVRTIINHEQETKFCAFSSLVVASTIYAQQDGNIQTVMDRITVGTSDSSNRIGDTIYLKSLSFRWNVTIGAGNEPDNFRLVLFQFNGVGSPGSGDVIVGMAAANNTGVVGPYNMDNASQYRILYDKTYSIDQYNQRKNDSFVITKFPMGRKVQYVSSGTNSWQKIYFYLISSLPTPAANHNPVVSYYWKLNYTDS